MRSLHTEPSNLRNLVIITNDWHMSRVRAIFDTVFNLPVMGAHGIQPSVSGTTYSLDYIEVAAFLPREVLPNRIRRESKSLQTFLEKVKPNLHFYHDLHHMVFKEHAAYSSFRLSEQFQPEKVDEKTKESY